MKILKITLLVGCLLSFNTMWAQQVMITGKVVDSTTHEELIGASVVVKGTTQGTITDIEGNFSLSIPQKSTLEISYIGYLTQTMHLAAQHNLNIQLIPNAKLIDEVVVIGYGTQKAKDLTAPISMIKGADLNKQIAANPMQALQGKLSGVQITNNGAPGSGASVKIRGVGSIGDFAKPLYVVDGVFVDNIDFLSGNDIEDLSVLKDASAAAIYGVRAANGVILVTTKKGQMGRTNVSYEGYVGMQVPTNIMKLTNTTQYVELYNLAFQNSTGFVPKDVANYPTSTDWYAELVRNALQHSHSVDVSGATEKTNYSFGLNFFSQDGIMNVKNNYQRFNLRGRLDQTVYSWLKMGINTVISSSNKIGADENVFYQAFINPPVYGVYDDTNTKAYPIKFGSPQQYGYSNSYGNPYATAYYNDFRENGYKIIASVYADFIIMPEKLNFRTSYNQDLYFFKNRKFQPEFLVGGSQSLKQSGLTKEFGYSTKQIIDNVLTYRDKIGAHSFTAMLGQSTRIEQYSNLFGSALGVIGYDEASKYLVTGSYKSRNAWDEAGLFHGLSAFARGTYNYDDRYLLTATFRADASSKYQDKWGYFPSIGAGWIITGEDFMKNQKVFDNLKLRASWGLLGNDNVPANSMYIIGTSGAESSGIFGDALVNGVGAQTVLQNYLKWEVVNEWNIGLDFATLNNRLSGEIDYYHRVTNNVVFSAPIASGGGKADLLANNGSVLNNGVELTINWDEKINNNSSYHISLNATGINNKVLSLIKRDYIPSGMIDGSYTTRTAVGHPIGSFYGYEIDRIYTSEAEALKDPVVQAVKDKGYFKYKDQDGDKKITEADKVYLGSPIPWLIAGLDIGYSYKKFDVSLMLQGQVGNKILNAKRMDRNSFIDGNYDLDFYNNAWRSDKPSKKYPSPEALANSNTRQANNFFVEDGSYIRIQNIQAGYTFTKIPFVKSLRIYLSAQRPLTLYSYNGFTPEIGGDPISAGIDRSVYPMQAVYTFGLNANF